ncbi:MAG: GNAT family N-acetyltransferase [Phycisphaerales bacterium]|nr:GNAT family N-acetyltransferase [Phycisphaerales bacterium]
MLSSRTLKAAAMFGLAPREARRGPSPTVPSCSRALGALLCLKRSHIALITGPSGSGKSLLLRRLRARAARPIVITPATAATLRAIPRTVLDLPAWRRDPLESSLSHLARAGLAEASLLLRTPAQLSDGQLARLAIALALRHAARRSSVTTILIDEFAASLDRASALTLAASLSRAVRASSNLKLIVATSHHDLDDPLAPSITVTTRLNEEPIILVSPMVSNRASPAGRSAALPARPVHAGHFARVADRFPIRPGSPPDYAALGRFHYLAGPPATCAHVLAIDDPSPPPGSHSQPIAVLVVSMPTLNGDWRAAAFPSLPSISDKRAHARELNRSVRTISRVIVDPRYRALGLATRLVQAYLHAPLTPHTEAIAAMGTACPFFEAAGMSRVGAPPTRRTIRLLAALHRAGIEPHDLLSLDPARDVADIPAPLAIDLHRWANDARATRSLAQGPLAPLLRAAAFHLASPRCIYAHSRPLDAL